MTINSAYKYENHSTLEKLILATHGSRFSSVERAVHTHLESILAEALQSNNVHGIAQVNFTDEQKKILAWKYWHAIQKYAIAGNRNLGGPYFLHPDEVFRILLSAGETDLVTLGVGLDHDIVEEFIAAHVTKQYNKSIARDNVIKSMRSDNTENTPAYKARLAFLKKLTEAHFSHKQKTTKQGARTAYKPSREQQMMKKYIQIYTDEVKSNLSALGVSCIDIPEFAVQLAEALTLLSRRRREFYYASMAHIFHPHRSYSDEAIERAITVKFADRLSNMRTMELPGATESRNDSRTYDSIINTDEDSGMFTTLSHPQRMVGEYTGEKRLYNCFKSIMLINCYRLRKLNNNKQIPRVAHLHLAEETKKQARIILDHLCSYHIDGTILTPQKVRQIYQQHCNYEQAGGYTAATTISDNPFDGIFQHFFDARVRGINEPLDSLYNNRHMMLVIAVAFDYLAKKYIEDSTFHVKGLTTKGLKTTTPFYSHNQTDQ